jgi:hypothetical protein
MDRTIRDRVLRDVGRVSGSFLQRLELVMNSYAYRVCSYVMEGQVERARRYAELFYYARLLYLKELKEGIKELERKVLEGDELERNNGEEVRVWHS